MKLTIPCLDELARSIASVRRILQTKWGGESSGQQDQLTGEAERVLKAVASSSLSHHLNIIPKSSFRQPQINNK